MSCSQVQGRILPWNSVLKCSCNSSELYLTHISSFLLVCTYATSLGFSHFQQYTIPSRNISSCWPNFGAQLYFFLLSDLNRGAPPETMCLDINQENGHHPIPLPPRNLLHASDVVFSDQAHEPEHSDKRILSVRSLGAAAPVSVLPYACIISAAGLYTTCKKHGIHLFCVKNKYLLNEEL